MAGPNSVPMAKQGNHVIGGKTSLRHAGLKSRENMTERDWAAAGAGTRTLKREPARKKEPRDKYATE